MGATQNKIIDAAGRYGVPAEIALAVAKKESGFRQSARSPVGAIGVMQLMPGTARELGVDPYDESQNIDGGVRYLKAQYQRFGSWDLALAAYNAGAGNVKKYGGVPPFAETQNYVKTIMGWLGFAGDEYSPPFLSRLVVVNNRNKALIRSM